MDKSYFRDSDNFVSPYLRRRLRPLAEVLHGDEGPGQRGARIEGEDPPNRGVDGLAAAATSSSENERNGQNCAD